MEDEAGGLDNGTENDDYENLDDIIDDTAVSGPSARLSPFTPAQPNNKRGCGPVPTRRIFLHDSLKNPSSNARAQSEISDQEDIEVVEDARGDDGEEDEDEGADAEGPSASDEAQADTQCADADSDADAAASRRASASASGPSAAPAPVSVDVDVILAELTSAQRQELDAVAAKYVRSLSESERYPRLLSSLLRPQKEIQPKT
jgi:hypothetical protein